jgi:hypothetical protein
LSAVFYFADSHSVDLMLFNGILPKCQHKVYFPPIFELIVTSAKSNDSGAKAWIVKPGNTN